MSLCALVFGVVQLILRGRDVVPHFAISPGSVESETSQFVGDGTVLPYLCGVSNGDTFCIGLLVVVFGLAALLLCCASAADVTSEFSKSYLELRERLDVLEAFLE